MPTSQIVVRADSDLVTLLALLARSRGADLSTEVRTAMRERLERTLKDDALGAEGPRARPDEAHAGAPRGQAP